MSTQTPKHMYQRLVPVWKNPLMRVTISRLILIDARNIHFMHSCTKSEGETNKIPLFPAFSGLFTDSF